MTELFKIYLDACWKTVHWNIHVARKMINRMASDAGDKKRKVAFIACVKQKRDGAHPAGDLFTSAWFIKAKEYVEKSGFDEWYILSAKHHLLSPNDEVASYEEHLNQFKSEKLDEWARVTADQIKEKNLLKDELHILGSEKYRSVSQYLHEGTICEPLKGLGISQQMAWMHQQIADCGKEATR